MSRHTDPELHEKLSHTEWLANWVAQEPEPRIIRGAMTGILTGAILLLLLLVVQAVWR